MEHQVRKDLQVIMVLMVYPVLQDQRVLQAQQAQALQVQLDLQVLMEHQVRKDLQVPQAQQAQALQVQLARQGIMVLMVYPVLLAPQVWVLLVLPAHQELTV